MHSYKIGRLLWSAAIRDRLGTNCTAAFNSVHDRETNGSPQIATRILTLNLDCSLDALNRSISLSNLIFLYRPLAGSTTIGHTLAPIRFTSGQGILHLFLPNAAYIILHEITFQWCLRFLVISERRTPRWGKININHILSYIKMIINRMITKHSYIGWDPVRLEHKMKWFG